MFICVIPDGFIIYDKNSLWIKEVWQTRKINIHIYYFIRMSRFVACLLGTQAYNDL